MTAHDLPPGFLPDGSATKGSALLRRRWLTGDRIFRTATGAAAALSLALIGLMVYDSISSTGPVFDRFGIWGFVTGARWSPSFTIYGALPFIYGTLLTGLIAVVLAVPIAIGIALLVTEFLPRRVAGPVAIVVDLLAAVAMLCDRVSSSSCGRSSRRQPGRSAGSCPSSGHRRPGRATSRPASSSRS